MYRAYEPWAHYSGLYFGVIIDRLDNPYTQIVTSHVFRLAHVSDPEHPSTSPDAAGYEETDEIQIQEPESAKYLTQLTAFYEDQTKLEALWSFIPSLRRVLRNSSNSRCAPSFGDFARDDVRGGFPGGALREARIRQWLARRCDDLIRRACPSASVCARSLNDRHAEREAPRRAVHCGP